MPVKKVTIKTYGDIAPGYNELYGREQCIKAHYIINRCTIPPDALLLDVGCGTGIASGLFGCKVIGIDPTMELLSQNNFPCVCGVGEYLPFCDNSFDFVVSLTALQNFFDVKKGLLEMNRVAKDKIIISVLKKAPRFEEIKQEIESTLYIEEVLPVAKDTIFFCRTRSTLP